MQAQNGFFVGVGVSWNVPTRRASGAFTDEADVIGDYVDWQVRIGYHPGVRVYVPPPPPAPPAPAAPAAAAEPAADSPRAVRAVHGRSRQDVDGHADAQDPDGDTLTYRWTAPAGTFAERRRSPDGLDGAAAGGSGARDGHRERRQGRAPRRTRSPSRSSGPRPVVELNFEDVYFDFDRSTLRPEALRLLDDAVARLQANPDKNIVIEGHTCNIGTAEYNLALGDRRASSVQEYLMSRGVPATRIETRSYGEEAAEVRQRARGNAPPEPARGARRQGAVGARRRD